MTSVLKWSLATALLALVSACVEEAGSAPDNGPSLGVEEQSLGETGGAKGDDVDTVTHNKAVATPITVMSVNVRVPEDGGQNSWANRRGRLQRMINRYESGAGPHMIGLQELRLSTFNDLIALLPQYWWYRVDRGDGEMLAIFVRTDRFAVLGYGYRDITNSSRDAYCGAGDNEDPKNRPVMYVEVMDRSNGTRSYLYNTHFPSKNSCERHGSADIVSEYIAGRANPSSRVILVGDLNDGFEADGRFNGSFSRLLSRTGLRIPYATWHPLNSQSAFATGNSWNKVVRYDRMIDFVLTSADIGAYGADVDRTMFTTGLSPVTCATVTGGRWCENGSDINNLWLYSDHWAVWARLTP